MLFWILICVAVALILLSANGTRDENCWGVFPATIVSVVALGLFSLMTHMVVGKINKETRIEARYLELVSLHNGPTSISGSFFLASGSFGSTEMYVYMYRTKNGDIRRAGQNAYRCVIREKDIEKPYRVYDRRYAKVSWLIPWEVRLFDSMPAFVVPPGTVTTLNQYEIE